MQFCALGCRQREFSGGIAVDILLAAMHMHFGIFHWLTILGQYFAGDLHVCCLNSGDTEDGQGTSQVKW